MGNKRCTDCGILEIEDTWYFREGSDGRLRCKLCHQKYIKKDGVFIQELDENQGLPKPRYGSRRIHYTNDLSPKVNALCRNKKARLFSFDEYKVTCLNCLQWKRVFFLKCDHERKQELERKKRTKQWAKNIGLKRSKGETFKEYVERFHIESKKQSEERKKKRLKLEIMLLDWSNVVTLPLDKDIQFPLRIIRYEDITYDSEWGEQPSLDELRESEYSGIEIPKTKYKKLLKEIIKLSRKQLKGLK